MTVAITLPDSTPQAAQSWHGMLAISERIGPEGWAVVGGQMTVLHATERGFDLPRVTDDGDIAVAVRAYPRRLKDVTQALHDLGFKVDNDRGDLPFAEARDETRYLKGSARIDLLVPKGLRPTSNAIKTVRGGRVLASHGVQRALERSEPVVVTVERIIGTVLRPDLPGAIAAKAAAYQQESGPKRDRHLLDIVTLGKMLGPGDTRREPWNRRELARVQAAVRAIGSGGRLSVSTTDVTTAVDLIELFARRS
ncbi:hypothetical protein [Microbacterium immunditiarum]|uniref:Putative nucleotidyltransferase n=1 Tax=Microbacterium immunditiarum TaxID=337480 RepID=A0A7Y9GS55_9MICO|nr:hypothetical protein [Microbacterium immunditiarum]NYE21386.1 putative nucleotidyltransferase [Microbacterium immunditiarum]